jgi:hypothetical protein
METKKPKLLMNGHSLYVSLYKGGAKRSPTTTYFEPFNDNIHEVLK